MKRISSALLLVALVAGSNATGAQARLRGRNLGGGKACRATGAGKRFGDAWCQANCASMVAAYPTLCENADGPPPDPVDGGNLLLSCGDAIAYLKAQGPSAWPMECTHITENPTYRWCSNGNAGAEAHDVIGTWGVDPCWKDAIDNQRRLDSDSRQLFGQETSDHPRGRQLEGGNGRARSGAQTGDEIAQDLPPADNAGNGAAGQRRLAAQPYMY